MLLNFGIFFEVYSKMSAMMRMDRSVTASTPATVNA